VATLWHGRFEGGPAEALRALNDSLAFDRRLYREDLAGSRAHVRGLARVGLLTQVEEAAVLAALDTVEDEMAAGRFEFAAGDEDIHTAVERRVTELAGAAGAKLHTGRSRNDQVATDLRLWAKRELAGLAELVLSLQATLLARASAAGDRYLPGYTHLQQAQPVLLAHHLLAHGWALARDVDRLVDAVHRTDVSPLGAGALAGSSLPLDPDAVAADLGFAARFENSLDAVSDRDFVAEALFVLAMVGVHLSRLGEELVLWASSEFAFVTLDDRFATGSSMMPQKKNPDVAELARAKAGRLVGHLAGLLATLKGLPLAYDKDLQEDKEPLFDAVDTVRLTLLALDGMVGSLVFDHARMEAAADSPYAAATDLAELLVMDGVPFREAHSLIGDLVRRAVAGDAPLAELVTGHPRLGAEAAALLAPGAAVRRRTSPGGGGPAAVLVQRDRFAARLATDQARIAAL
jgi:argininosuccinate lyase